LRSSNDAAVLLERTEDRIAQIAENRIKMEKCRDDVHKPYRQKLGKVYRSVPFLAAAGLGTITFGWLIAFLAIAIARWIKARGNKKSIT
jgi:hypothetical protein